MNWRLAIVKARLMVAGLYMRDKITETAFDETYFPLSVFEEELI